MGDDGADIIVFPVIPGSDAIGPPAEIKEKPKGWQYPKPECVHRKPVLDMTAHRLVCKDCKQELDCFDWIVDYTRRWARFNTEYRQAMSQRDEAIKRVAELERVERNIKSRIRRPGVTLTRGQLRKIRDTMRALRRAVDYALRDRVTTEDERHKVRNELKLLGLDFALYTEMMKLLDDEVELRVEATEAAPV